MIETLDPHRLSALNLPIPRYTSYPTAPVWEPLDAPLYAERLRELGRSSRPVSLYFHIPFCKTMCLYCGCSVVLNRKEDKEERYVETLGKEIALVAETIGRKATARQLHFGGGTPTKLNESQLTRLMGMIEDHFTLDGEISIEIDPRTVVEDEGKKLTHLKSLGFNRVSFGVQDTNPKVQEAVRRNQSVEMTRETYERARVLGFEGINVDLIYGLPFQTPETFRQTVIDILEMRPDRIAMYSYAKVPWLKPHQKAIREETLPSTEEKFEIYVQAREQFLAAGYVAIGMDHFALADDSMARAYREKELQRNFQGYSLKLANDLIGMGVTSTGLVSECYAQNLKELDAYTKAVEAGLLPILRGKPLSFDDQIRKWVIHRIMCDFELDTSLFDNEFGTPFATYFHREQKELERLQSEEMITWDGKVLKATLYGSLFIRNVVSIFDAYLHGGKRDNLFSRGV